MGLLHIYCGDGKGKTTTAVGLTVRALGNGMRVMFVQLMKDGSSSELKILERLPGVDVLFCPKKRNFFKFLSDSEKAEFCRDIQSLFDEAMTKTGYDMVILDEFMSAYGLGLLDKPRALEALRAKKETAEIVLTGRDPEPELQALADYISCIQKQRHPFDEGVPAREGIEY